MILNEQSPLPLYHQLASLLLEKIRRGEYLPGNKIPSETELAKEFSIGRPTVRQATEVLVRQKILMRKRGSGTYVCDTEEEVDLFSLAGTMSAFIKKGITLTRKNIEKARVVKNKGDMENPFNKREVLFLSRLNSTKGYPFLIEDIYIDKEVFPSIETLNLSSSSLSQFIFDHYKMKPTHGKQSFTIRFPDKKQAALLKISEKDPLLFVRRYLHFGKIENAIYSELYCRTDKYEFTQKIGGR